MDGKKEFKEIIMKKIVISIAISFTSISSFANSIEKCQLQKIESVKVDMCLQPGANFQHDQYILKFDNSMIFSLTDDYAENVQLEHIIPAGSALEFPLSLQGEKSIKISGGCAPVSKDGMEVARICNFSMGKHQIVNNVRFEF